jgi:hypothetical protein
MIKIVQYAGEVAQNCIRKLGKNVNCAGAVACAQG